MITTPLIYQFKSMFIVPETREFYGALFSKPSKHPRLAHNLFGIIIDEDEKNYYVKFEEEQNSTCLWGVTISQNHHYNEHVYRIDKSLLGWGYELYQPFKWFTERINSASKLEECENSYFKVSTTIYISMLKKNTNLDIFTINRSIPYFRDLFEAKKLEIEQAIIKSLPF